MTAPEAATRPLVAIDGPAGSGKSTVSRAVAQRLGVEVLDTGAMYRAVTYAVLRGGHDPDDAAVAGDVAQHVDIGLTDGVTVDGEQVTAAIRGPEVTAAVSAVAAHASVREALVAHQRAWVDERGGGVVEGRDIGTVVLPDAPVKVFLTADEDTRAARRQSDEAAADRDVDAAAVRQALARRDSLDSERSNAPLKPADDAVVIDTTDMSVDEVADRIVALVENTGVSS